MRQPSYFENILNDPLFIVVAGLQVFHVEFEQIQGSRTWDTLKPKSTEQKTVWVIMYTLNSYF